MTKTMSCFICNGPHYAKYCLKVEKLSILIIVKDNGDFDLDVPSRMNPLQLLNVIHTNALIQKEIMYVQVLVNGVWLKVMMDSEVAHNFMASKETVKLGLELE